MKTLKPIFKAFALILLLAFVSCKKDGAVKPGPDPEPKTPVVTNDLLTHNILLEIKNQDSELLRAISFNKDGATVKATWDGAGARRIVPVSIINNTLTIDPNGNGKVIYTFVFDKDSSGNIKMASSTYYNQDDASFTMTAIIFKTSDATSFANKKFTAQNAALFIKFSDAHKWSMSANRDFDGAVWADYYDVAPGIWKGTYNGSEYMGVGVSQIKDGKKVDILFVQKAGGSAYGILTNMP